MPLWLIVAEANTNEAHKLQTLSVNTALDLRYHCLGLKPPSKEPAEESGSGGCPQRQACV